MRIALTTTSSRKAQLAVNTAFPMDQQHHFSGRLIYVHDDFMDECSNDALAQARIGVGPERLEPDCKVEELFSTWRGDVLFAVYVLVELFLHSLYLLQSLVPSALELVSDQSVLGIAASNCFCARRRKVWREKENDRDEVIGR